MPDLLCPICGAVLEWGNFEIDEEGSIIISCFKCFWWREY